jgi:Holliday junction resolvase RusA-like endonuclease
MKITILGDPRTKKNSQRIVSRGRYKRILPSEQYIRYETSFISQCELLHIANLKLAKRYNIACVYYMQTKRKVDLTNLLSGTMDCLVSAGVIEDDNCKIAVSHDGSYVDYDKENPRVEIVITSKEN